MDVDVWVEKIKEMENVEITECSYNMEALLGKWKRSFPPFYNLYIANICENTTSRQTISVRWWLFSSFPDGRHYQEVTVEEDSCNDKEKTGQLEPKLIFEWGQSPSVIQEMQQHWGNPYDESSQGIQDLHKENINFD